MCFHVGHKLLILGMGELKFTYHECVNTERALAGGCILDSKVWTKAFWPFLSKFWLVSHGGILDLSHQHLKFKGFSG